MELFELLLHVRGAEKALEFASTLLEQDDPIGAAKEIENAKDELKALRKLIEGESDGTMPS